MNKCSSRIFLAVMFLIFGSVLFADEWSAPASYYSSVSGSGSTLRSELKSVMSYGHHYETYDEIKYSSAVTDADPDHSGNILLCYTKASVSSTWDGGNTWNREHVWPQSRQSGSSPGSLSDPHCVLPCNSRVNSQRGNMPFGGINLTGNNRSSGSYYFPGDYDKGDIARCLFYCAVRYDMELVNGMPSGDEMGDLASLLRWHYMDAPDEFERRRNHTIYSRTYNSYYTNNRNAFVDHPEYVWSVFGGNDNDTTIYVGDSVDADGISEISGVLDEQSNTELTVTIHKTGSDGTYFQIETTGDIVCSQTGKFAFDYGQQSKTVTVSLEPWASLSAGDVAGQITIVNLDVCTGSSQGCGGYDGDDVVTVYYSSQGTGLVGDINADGWVDSGDLAEMAYDWLVDYGSETPVSDIAGEDSFVDNLDFAVLASAWGDSLYAIVPDVVGDVVEEAIAEVEGNDLQSLRVDISSETVEEGLVISTDPAAGEVVDKGFVVTVYVSTGAEPVATVPNLVSTLYTGAEAALISANLMLGDVTEVYSETVSEGYIVSQYPVSGTTTSYNTEVDLVVSLGPEPVIGDGFVIITGVLDGDLSGGNPKCAELYVSGTVDLSSYSVNNYNNGSSSSSNTTSLSGTYTNEYVYVVKSDSASSFVSCFGSAGDFANVISGAAPNISGDDCVVLFNGDEIVDVYGHIGVDGTGTSWEQKDGFAIRLDGERPSSIFDVSGWSVDKGGVDGLTAAQHGTTVPFGEYIP